MGSQRHDVAPAAGVYEGFGDASTLKSLGLLGDR
jgi:hypothetical protein